MRTWPSLGFHSQFQNSMALYSICHMCIMGALSFTLHEVILLSCVSAWWSCNQHFSCLWEAKLAFWINSLWFYVGSTWAQFWATVHALNWIISIFLLFPVHWIAEILHKRQFIWHYTLTWWGRSVVCLVSFNFQIKEHHKETVQSHKAVVALQWVVSFSLGAVSIWHVRFDI